MHYHWLKAAAEKELELELAIQSVWVLCRINEITNSGFLKTCSHYNFVKYLKEALSPSHVLIQNIPSDVCYNDTKHCHGQFVKSKASGTIILANV